MYEEKSVIKIFYDNDRGGWKLVPELSTLVLELYGFVDINTTTGYIISRTPFVKGFIIL